MIYKSIAVVFYFASLISGSPPTEKLVFYETFDTDPFDTTWFKSLDQKYKDQPILIAPASNPILGFEEDKGLKLTQEMKYYAFGAKFAQPLETKTNNEDIVIQYEVKLEETLACGGAYVKLPRATPELDMTLINNDTPYSIMFGPDKCGNNNKVHFILQFQNPITLEWEEKHFNETINVKNDKKVHLYTLVLSADNSFDILIDSHSAKKGNLLTHMVPPINPAATIPDITDSKPSTWVDAAEIDDPTVEKPLDWDEEAPRKIPDLNAVKPIGWADDAPEKIPDPEAQKPGDWDDEEDGEWEAPPVPNPLCDQVGCGVWSAPTVVNPAYKGKWRAPKIPNPDFIGVWAPREIPNPSYFEDLHPFLSIAPMAGIAVEVWTTSAGILFDNFLVARSLSDALAFAKHTFKPKAEAEIAQHKAEQAAQTQRDREESVAKGGFRAYMEVKVLEAAEFFNANPYAVFASLLAVGLTFIYLVLFGGKDVKIVRKERKAPAAASQESAPAVEEEPAADEKDE